MSETPTATRRFLAPLFSEKKLERADHLLTEAKDKEPSVLSFQDEQENLTESEWSEFNWADRYEDDFKLGLM